MLSLSIGCQPNKSSRWAGSLPSLKAHKSPYQQRQASSLAFMLAAMGDALSFMSSHPAYPLVLQSMSAYCAQAWM